MRHDVLMMSSGQVVLWKIYCISLLITVKILSSHEQSNIPILAPIKKLGMKGNGGSKYHSNLTDCESVFMCKVSYIPKTKTAYLQQSMQGKGLTVPLHVHFLIQQQALCFRFLKWDSVMKVVVSCINFFRAKRLKHRQLQQFLFVCAVLYRGPMVVPGQCFEAFL